MCGDCRNHRARLPACLTGCLTTLLARSLTHSLAWPQRIYSPAYLRQCAASIRRTCCCIALRYTVAAANVSPIYLPAIAYSAGFLFPTLLFLSSSLRFFFNLLSDGESLSLHFHRYPQLLKNTNPFRYFKRKKKLRFRTTRIWMLFYSFWFFFLSYRAAHFLRPTAANRRLTKNRGSMSFTEADRCWLMISITPSIFYQLLATDFLLTKLGLQHIILINCIFNK